MTTSASPGLSRFVKQYTVLLTSHKKDGTGVGTPVSLAVEGDHAYFRTFSSAWKAKRMRRDPLVEIAPSTLRGAPTGPAVHARVRLLDQDSEENRHAADLLRHKHPFLHGALVPLAHRAKRERTLHYEVRLIDESDA